jgi:hypothetical protein
MDTSIRIALITVLLIVFMYLIYLEYPVHNSIINICDCKTKKMSDVHLGLGIILILIGLVTDKSLSPILFHS